MATVALSFSFWIFLFLSTLLDQKRDGEREGGESWLFDIKAALLSVSLRAPAIDDGTQRRLRPPFSTRVGGNPRRRRRRSIWSHPVRFFFSTLIRLQRHSMDPPGTRWFNPVGEMDSICKIKCHTSFDDTFFD